MIIGTPFIRSRKVILDFENDVIRLVIRLSLPPKYWYQIPTIVFIGIAPPRNVRSDSMAGSMLHVWRRFKTTNLSFGVAYWRKEQECSFVRMKSMKILSNGGR